MYKKIIFFLIVCLALTVCMPVFANPEEENADSLNEEILSIVTEKDSEETEQFLVTITRPDGDEITHRKSYVICGVANEGKIPENLVVVLLVYNENTEEYELLENIDGESSWAVGSFGMFTKEVMLKEGANKIKIVVYDNSADKWQAGENLQINTFTVTVLKEGIRQKILNGTLKISEFFQGILPGLAN
ncbi:MAG TPA: hypothetical protein GXX20_09205 [Clostridiaceae bacterium]|nr:hypothetical protein [Clostridiaceae bacterium]